LSVVRIDKRASVYEDEVKMFFDSEASSESSGFKKA
jgi:hypothetical protein